MASLSDVSIIHYRHFLMVADLRSFRLAAARAFRSQPALSLSIREMEQRLGEPLFEPGDRVRLTPYGEKCLPLVREFVAHHERVTAAIGGLARSDTGTLTLGMVGTAASHWLPDLVAHYSAEHPGVSMRLFDDNSETIERMVLTGQVELAVCSPVNPDKRLRFEPLIHDDFGLVCHRDHALANRGSVTWREISTLPLIGTVAHRQLAHVPQAAFLMSRPLFVSNMMSLLAMLKRGVGVTVLARLGLPPDAPELRFVPLTRPKVQRTLGMMRLAQRSLSPAAARMREMLLAQCAS